MVAKVFLGNHGVCEKVPRERSGSATSESTADGDSDDDDDDDDRRLGAVDEDSGDSGGDSDDDADDGSVGADAVFAAAAGTGCVRPRAFPNLDAVYRVNAADPKQRNWFVFDNALYN